MVHTKKKERWNRGQPCCTYLSTTGLTSDLNIGGQIAYSLEAVCARAALLPQKLEGSALFEDNSSLLSLYGSPHHSQSVAQQASPEYTVRGSARISKRTVGTPKHYIWLIH